MSFVVPQTLMLQFGQLEQNHRETRTRQNSVFECLLYGGGHSDTDQVVQHLTHFSQVFRLVAEYVLLVTVCKTKPRRLEV